MARLKRIFIPNSPILFFILVLGCCLNAQKQQLSHESLLGSWQRYAKRTEVDVAFTLGKDKDHTMSYFDNQLSPSSGWFFAESNERSFKGLQLIDTIPQLRDSYYDGGTSLFLVNRKRPRKRYDLNTEVVNLQLADTYQNVGMKYRSYRVSAKVLSTTNDSLTICLLSESSVYLNSDSTETREYRNFGNFTNYDPVNETDAVSTEMRTFALNQIEEFSFYENSAASDVLALFGIGCIVDIFVIAPIVSIQAKKDWFNQDRYLRWMGWGLAGGAFSLGLGFLLSGEVVVTSGSELMSTEGEWYLERRSNQ